MAELGRFEVLAFRIVNNRVRVEEPQKNRNHEQQECCNGLHRQAIVPIMVPVFSCLFLRLERGDAFTFATPHERNTARRQTPN